MRMRLLDVEGENYFFMKSKDKDRILADVSAKLRLPISHNEQFLEDSKKKLYEIIGFREAEKIGSFDGLSQIVSEEINRRSNVINPFHGRFLDSALRAAGQSVRREFPNFDVEYEFNRDGIFLTLQRSGLVDIYNLIFGVNLDINDVTNKLANGEHLRHITPCLNPELLELLGYSMSNSLDRKLFLYRLANTYNLDNQQVSDIGRKIYFSVPQRLEQFTEDIHRALPQLDEDLERRLIHFFYEGGRFEAIWQNLLSQLRESESESALENIKEILKRSHHGIGTSQPVALGRGLGKLVSGNNDIGRTVASGDARYLRQFYTLAHLLLENLELKHFDETVYHTQLIRASSSIRSTFLRTYHGIAQNILNYIATLTQLDPSQYTTQWELDTSRYILLYPKNKFDETALGQIYGLFVLSISGFYTEEPKVSRGFDRNIKYSLNRRKIKNKEEIESIIEQFGSLNQPLNVVSTEMDLVKLYHAINRDIGYYKIHIPHQRILNIPHQFNKLIQTIENNPEYQTSAFIKSALRMWLEESRHPDTRLPYSGYVKSISEDKLLNLAQKIGLQLLPRKSQLKESKLYKVANPELLYN